jgi:hypothetical protein
MSPIHEQKREQAKKRLQSGPLVCPVIRFFAKDTDASASRYTPYASANVEGASSNSPVAADSNVLREGNARKIYTSVKFFNLAAGWTHVDGLSMLDSSLNVIGCSWGLS